MTSVIRFARRVVSRTVNRCVPLGTAVVLLLSSCTIPTLGSAKPSIQVVDLRCEYLKNPVGLDVRQPRLSWKLAATRPNDRGQRQAAYQVWVAGDSAALARHQGDLWDSGEVASDESAHIVYRGQPLRSGMELLLESQGERP